MFCILIFICLFVVGFFTVMIKYYYFQYEIYELLFVTNLVLRKIDTNCYEFKETAICIVM